MSKPTREQCAEACDGARVVGEVQAEAWMAKGLQVGAGYLRTAAARIAELEAERDRWKANAQDWADDAAGAKAERDALAAEVEELTAERDAARDVANAPADAFMEKRAEWWAEHAVLVRQLASCRKALEWIREQCIGVFGADTAGCETHYWADETADGEPQAAIRFRANLSAAAGVPLADLTGEEVPA